VSEPNWANQTIWTGDNLDIMRGMNSASVDLIYLDPPFNSDQDYEAPIGSPAEGAHFKDIWTLEDVDLAWHGEIADVEPDLYQVIEAAGAAHGDSMKAYLVMMSVRLLEMRRLLKPTGSIYLHCDDYADAYLRLTMDSVFGQDAFCNAITWQRQSSKALSIRKYARNSDRILYYRMSKDSTWNQQYVEFSEKYLDSFRYEDDLGRYNTQPLTGGRPGGSEAYGEFKGVLPSAGRAWAPPRREKFPPDAQILLPGDYEKLGQIEKCEALDDAGLIHWSSKGVPRYKSYLSMREGVHVGDIVIDIFRVTGHEDVGYPTQKPVDLLQRLIAASSNPGDVLLDPFCGCATACVAAEDLERQWVGIDIAPRAADLVVQRLKDELGLFFTGTHRTDLPQRTDLGPVPPPASATNRHVLYGQQEGNCNGCLAHFPFRNMTVDHIVPRSRGGTDHFENLQLLCGACNSTKGAGTQEELIARLRAQGIRD